MLYKTVLFDLDGTLIESGPGIFAAARFVMREMGIEDIPDDKLVKMIGPPLADCFRHVIGVPEERVFEATERYHAAAKTIGLDLIKPYPGIPELLQKLKAMGATVGVVTSKVTPTAKEHLSRFGLAPYIDYLRGGIPGGSADKLMLVEAARDDLPGPSSSKVMIGDRHFDLNAAKRAGLPSIGVTYGYGSAEEIAASSPTYTVNSVAELSALLTD